MSVVIRIEQLSKVYHLGEISRRMLWQDWRRRLTHAPEEEDPDLFWALHDVTFDIREGEVVGLIFDGNIHSIAGVFWYNPLDNRAVSVDTTALLEALRVVYGAHALLSELGAPAG